MTNPPGYRGAVQTPGGLFDGVFGRGQVDTSDRAWLQAMLDTEAALARALEAAGLAAPGAGAAVTEAAQAGAFDPAWLGEQAALTGNPVPALVRELGRRLPPDAAAAVHKGATSQDILDTAAMLLARQALAAVAADLAAAAGAAARLAAAHRDTLMIGRTLLQQAVPVTFGLVAAGWLTGLDEARSGAGPGGRTSGSRCSSAGRRARWPRWAAPGRRWRAAGRRTRPGRARAALAHRPAADHRDRRGVRRCRRRARQDRPGRDPAGPVRGGRGPRARRGRPGWLVGHAAQANPVAAIAVLGCTKQVPGLLATLAVRPSRSTSVRPGRGTRSGSRWATCSGSPGRPRPGRRTCWPGCAPTRPGCGPTWTPRAASRWPSTSRRCSPRPSAGPRRTTWSPRPARGPRRPASRCARPAGPAPEAGQLAAAGVTPGQVEQALDPAGYLGAAGEFVTAALAAHRPTADRRAEWPAMNDAERHEPGDDRPPGGAGRCARGPGGGRDHRLHRAVPGLHHPVRVGRGVVPARADPGRAEHDHADRARRAAARKRNWPCTCAPRCATGSAPEQIREVLLHTAIYAGVPAANRAFAIAQRVLAETA